MSGVWHQTTVVNIGRNLLLAAVCRYGVRSMGDQLRFSPEGPRQLTEEDYRLDGKPKVVRNFADLVRHAPALFEAVIPTSDHDHLQQILDARSTSQRGKPRSRDPKNNPLGTRVFDLHCGWPMYRAPYKESFRYACGLYVQSNATHCNHNWIVGVKAMRLVVNAMLQKLLTPARLEKLYRQLNEIAANNSERSAADPRPKLEQEIAQVRVEQEKIARNMALSETPDQRAAVARIYDNNAMRIGALQTQLKDTPSPPPSTGAAAQVHAALSVLDRLTKLPSSAGNLEAIGTAVQLTNAKIFLGFRQEQLKKRVVNKLSHGVITFGETMLQLSCTVVRPDVER